MPHNYINHIKHSHEFVDTEWQGVIFTLITDLLCFAFCVGLAYWIRKPSLISAFDGLEYSFSDFDQQDSIIHRLTQKGYLIFERIGFGFQRTFKLPQEGVLYLRFLQYCIISLSALCVINLLFLLPVYIFSGGIEELDDSNVRWLFICSARNMPFASRWMLLSILVAIISAVIIACMLREFMYDVEAIGSSVKPDPRSKMNLQSHAIYIKNIQPNVTGEILAQHFNERFGGDEAINDISKSVVVEAHIIYELDSAINIFRHREKINEKLKKVSEENNKEIIERFQNELNHTEHKLTLEITNQTSRNSTGNGFVFFKNKNQALRALEKSRRKTLLNDKYWKISIAPLPRDILWNNMTHKTSKCMRWIKYIFLNVLLFITMIAIITPISVSHYLAPFIQSIGSFNIVGSMIASNLSMYAPTLAIVIVNSVFLPVAIDWTANQEIYKLKEKRAKSILHKNCFFLFLNVIVLPTLALESIRVFVQLTQAKHGLDQWQQLVGSAFLYSSGSFFMQYTIQAGLLGAGVQLLNIPQRVLRWWKLQTAETKHEIDDAMRTSAFDFGLYYSMRLTMLGLVLLYSIFTPLLLPCGLLYFIAYYNVDKYNLENRVYRVATATGLAYKARLPRNVVGFLSGYILLFLFAVSSFLIVTGDYFFHIIASIMFFCLLLLFVFLAYKFYISITDSRHRDYSRVSSRMALLDTNSVSINSISDFAKEYHHPLLRPEFRHLHEIPSETVLDYEYDEERQPLLHK